MNLHSILYVPGSNQRALERARDLPVDALILDLEDSVLPEFKTSARDSVRAIASSLEVSHRAVAVRVNDLKSAWFEDDLRIVAVTRPTAVVVPKITSPEDVAMVRERLTEIAPKSGIDIWVTLETPGAILRASAILTAADSVGAAIFGSNDLLATLGGHTTPGREALTHSMQLMLLATRATGRIAFDGVYNDIRNPVGFRFECEQGRQIGFDGKTLIHPDQVAPCNEIYGG